jgi:malonyl-CoA O-methyltransferase
MSGACLFDKAKLKQSFGHASVSYDLHADLQRERGCALLESVDLLQCQDVLLDLGCGTGFFTRELLLRLKDSDAATVVAVDIAEAMLHEARRKLSTADRVGYLCADADYLPFAKQSLNAVFSNLAFQWSSNPEALFAELFRIIKPKGLLAFSTFGPGTLQELKTAWLEVDGYRHINEFYHSEQLNDALHTAGFSNILISEKTYCRFYDSVLALMHELKKLGAQNVLFGRSKGLTGRWQMQKMINAYEKERVGGKIPATFSAIWVSAVA